MIRILRLLVVLAVIGIAATWFLSRPGKLPDAFAMEISAATGSTENGEAVFWAGGCASCHAAPKSDDDAKLVLSGGQSFPSDFGIFYAPNISPDPDAGIGGWTLDEFARALNRGVSPSGEHYYPAFPYTSYIRMTAQDVADLKAFMDSLPPDQTVSKPHDVMFPFNIRRGLGLWKLLYLDPDWVVADVPGKEAERGRYLSEALAHCGDCHTPRTALGGLDLAMWMSGAPNPSGRGTIPNITPAGLNWSETDIAYYLETGFTPAFDAVGGHMAAVVANFGKLPAEDRAAVAAYLKALPPVERPIEQN